MSWVVDTEFIKDTDRVTTLRSLFNKVHPNTLLRLELCKQGCCILWQNGISKLRRFVMWGAWMILVTTESKVRILTTRLQLFDSLKSFMHFAFLMKVIETEFFAFLIFAYM